MLIEQIYDTLTRNHFPLLPLKHAQEFKCLPLSSSSFSAVFSRRQSPISLNDSENSRNKGSRLIQDYQMQLNKYQ